MPSSARKPKLPIGNYKRPRKPIGPRQSARAETRRPSNAR